MLRAMHATDGILHPSLHTLVLVGALATWAVLLVLATAGLVCLAQAARGRQPRRSMRTRRSVGPATLAFLTPVLRYSYSRDAYVLRVVGRHIGPVLQREAEYRLTPSCPPSPLPPIPPTAATSPSSAAASSGWR